MLYKKDSGNYFHRLKKKTEKKHFQRDFEETKFIHCHEIMRYCMAYLYFSKLHTNDEGALITNLKIVKIQKTQ